MSARETLAGLLRENRPEEVIALARKDRRTVRILAGLLFHEEELVMWRAVTMLGHLAVAEPGLTKPVVARLLWSLAEEASIVGWGSNQALGEIYRRNPAISGNTGRVAAHYLDDEELSDPSNRNTTMLAGSIWAIGEISGTDPALSLEMAPRLVGFLADPEPQVRAVTAWTLGRLKYLPAASALEAMSGDDAMASVYEDEELKHLAVRDFAAIALKNIVGP